MTQLDIYAKNVMSTNIRSVKIVSVGSVISHEAKFKEF